MKTVKAPISLVRSISLVRPKSFIWLALALAAAGACATDPQAASRQFLASGDEYLEAGKVAEAILEYRNAAQRDPQAPEVRVRLGDAYLRAGDLANAVQEHVRAADLLSEDTDAQLRAGHLLLLSGRFADARLWAEKILLRKPADLQAQILLANSHAGLKDFDSAVTEIEEAIRLAPDRGDAYANLGAFELGRGQKEAAERAFLRAVEIDEGSPAARLALANFYWVDARFAAAEQQFQMVVEMDSANVLAHRALASFYIATRRPDEAEAHLRRLVELTDAPAAVFALADFYGARDNDKAARALLDPLTDGAGTSAAAQVRLATLDFKVGQRERAYGRLERVVSQDRANLPALLARTNFLAADGRLDEAFASAEAAAQAYPDAAAALFALGRVQAARRETDAAIRAYSAVVGLNPRATDAKIALARLHLTAGNTGASIGLAQETLATEPENVDARLVLVRSLIARRDLARAEAEIGTLVARFPDSGPIHVQQGIVLALKKDLAGARRSFERALAADPRSPDAFGGVVGIDIATGRALEARARLDARIEDDMASAALLTIAARGYLALRDAATAERLLRRAIALEPADLGAYGDLARIYVAQGRLDAALTEFEELARRDPRPIAALTFAGILLQGQGKTREAQARYERVLDLDPGAAVAANNLAWIYAHSGGNLDAALQLARTAHGALPTTPEVGDTLGVIYTRKNLLPEAIEVLKATVDLAPDGASYHHHLSQALAKAGERAAAIEHAERALALRPKFDGAADARALLDSLKPR